MTGQRTNAADLDDWLLLPCIRNSVRNIHKRSSLSQRFDFAERNVLHRLIPRGIEFVLVDGSPSLHQLQLFDWKTSRDQFAIHANRGFVLVVINMKVRLVVLVSVAENHLDNDVIKSAKFRHDLLLAFSVFKIASSFAPVILLCHIIFLSQQ